MKRREAAGEVACPKCRAQPGEPCRDGQTVVYAFHVARGRAAKAKR